MSEYNEIHDKMIDQLTEDANDSRVFSKENFFFNGFIEIQNDIAHAKFRVIIEEGEILIVDNFTEAYVLNDMGKSIAKNVEHWKGDELLIFETLITCVPSIQEEIINEAYREYEK